MISSNSYVYLKILISSLFLGFCLFSLKRSKKHKHNLFMGLLVLGSFSGVSAQNLATDRADYWPGSTAMITGRGFTPGETVTLVVLHYNAPTETRVCHNPW